MKKLTYLLLVMFAIVLMSTSCEEESLTIKTEGVNDGLMTLAELGGHWYVESYLYDGILWTFESDVPTTYKGLEDIFNWDWDFDIQNMTTEYGGYFTYDFTKEDNTIKISFQGDNLSTYTITDYSGDKFVVKYEDLEEDRLLFKYKGGTITFVR
jgi:hypothetical protein